MVPMILAVNVMGTEVGGGLGRARTMAVVEVEAGEIRSWTETEVGWDVLHDAPPATSDVAVTPPATSGAAAPASDPDSASPAAPASLPGSTPSSSAPSSGPASSLSPASLQGHTHAPGAGHGAHHARIVRFLKEHRVDAVVTGHAGPPMLHTLELMGVGCVIGASGDARQAALDAVNLIESSGTPA